jgi:monooxygenase
MPANHVDVLIIGAGISGIGAAVHLKQDCPNKSFTILERRPNLGGTWDLFRYPGIRSDSDMYTLGFSFKPWTSRKAIADGPAILAYLNETVDEHNLRKDIRHGYQVLSASWSSAEALWTVSGKMDDGAPFSITANMIFSCTGYYNYDKGYTPDFPGIENFQGQLVHPQHWPESLDYRGKSIAVIGSGATAVTLVPAMIDRGAAKVTMVQRTPTWMISRPSEDKLVLAMQKLLPAKIAYAITRYRNTIMQQILFKLARKRPHLVGNYLLKKARKKLGPDYDVKTHLTPPYGPWEQRLCLIPDSDMFRVLRNGEAEIATGQIDQFTENGIILKSGRKIDADIIVSATGLNLQMLAGADITIDGKPLIVGEKILYKGIMFNDVPNFAMWFGYTNASWTLKADLTSQYMCRLINHMDETKQRIAIPVIANQNFELQNFVDFSSGYFQRAWHMLPKSGTRPPWTLYQNYIKDVTLLRKGPLTDEMRFSNPTLAETA